MRVQLLSIGSKNPAWLETALAEYDQKLNHNLQFSRKVLKTKNSPRDEAQVKKTAEAKEFLENIDPKAYVILLDEKGKQFKGSIAFSEAVVKVLSGSASQIVFIIGGAYGVDDTVRERAQAIWSLSDLTLNHHLIQAVFCEQLYRAITIWKGIPYHNS